MVKLLVKSTYVAKESLNEDVFKRQGSPDAQPKSLIPQALFLLL